MPRLTFKSEDSFRSLELREGVNRLGRAAENDFVLDHPTVSSGHCEVVVEAGSIWVRDCGSTNGTFVNGRRITQAPLRLEDTLRLGDLELVLLPSLPPVAIPLSAPLVVPCPPLPDGSVGCLNHAQRPATYGCTRCQGTFCAACIHELHRVGGRSHKLCPRCSGECTPLAAPARRRRRSLLDWLRGLKGTRRLRP